MTNETSAGSAAELDWSRIARAAGKYGIRYPTNSRMEDFLREVSAFAASPSPVLRDAVIVPREPTEAMLDAMEQWVGSHSICRRRAWLAALAAADRSAS